MEIYLDNAATTRPSIGALEAHIGTGWYNPSAAYAPAEAVFGAIGKTRKLLLEKLGMPDGSCIFTSGGTEANNIAIFSSLRRGAHFVTSTVEHPSVHAVLTHLAQQGLKVSFIKPRGFMIHAKDVAAEVREDTALVSIMHVNNETGALSDIAAICAAVKARNSRTLFHSDGVQALYKTHIDLSAVGADYYSVSAHKIHGLKGTGALLCRKGALVKPMLFGGGQETGMRPGTENTLGIQVFDAVLREVSGDTAHIETLRTMLVNGLSAMPGAVLNLPEHKVSHIVSVSFEGVRAEVLARLLGQQGIYIGTGAACARGKISRVLLECGLRRTLAEGTVRISLCRHNTAEEISIFLDALKQAAAQLRRLA